MPSPVRVKQLHLASGVNSPIDTVTTMDVGAPQLRVERGPHGIVVAGEVDSHTAALLREALIPGPPHGDLRVDMSEVTFIDSSGLRVIIDAHQEMQRDARRLILVAPSRSVARVIAVTGLIGHLQVEPPLDTPS